MRFLCSDVILLSPLLGLLGVPWAVGGEITVAGGPPPVRQLAGRRQEHRYRSTTPG